MTFEELPLYEAIHKVYPLVDSPRSSEWLISRSEELCRLIQPHLEFGSLWQREDVLRAWDQYGKSVSANESQKKIELTIVVANLFGRKCFYAGRGLGDCSPDVTLERIIPGSLDGLYVIENCVIACSFHNSQRGNAPIEEYIRTAFKCAERVA